MTTLTYKLVSGPPSLIFSAGTSPPAEFNTTVDVRDFISYGSTPEPTSHTTVNLNLTHTDPVWPGFGKTVSGVVTETGIPVSRLLRLYDTASGHLITQMMSDPDTGQYEFVGIGSPLVDVVAKDPPKYRAQIYDRVVPV